MAGDQRHQRAWRTGLLTRLRTAPILPHVKVEVIAILKEIPRYD